VTVYAAVVLPGVPESVREARAMVRRQLTPGDAAEAAALCVSELVTNAIAYTRSGLPGGSFAVSVQAGPGGVVIRVRDGGARTRPVLADPEPAVEHGRGLAIVAAVADEWGTEPAAAGRATWFRIAA
jgi:anti-sigma regulatory factor (Ser/Thr protein kinase)